MLHMDQNGELYEAPRGKTVSLNACTNCPNLTPNLPNFYGNVYCDICLIKKERTSARSAAKIEIPNHTGTVKDRTASNHEQSRST